MAHNERSVLTERGGAFSAASQMGKNYMQYLSGGAYDDDTYASYAPGNYGADGTPLSISGNTQVPGTLRMNNPGGPAPTSPGKGFEVMNREVIESEPQHPSRPPVMAPRGDPGNYYSCPACGILASKTCGCQFRDASCSQGHAWFWADGKKQPGISPNHK